MDFKNKNLIITLVSILVGLIAGFAYWRFVGCSSGTCPITANWYLTTLFGGVFGYLLSDSFKPKKKEENVVGE